MNTTWLSRRNSLKLIGTGIATGLSGCIGGLPDSTGNPTRAPTSPTSSASELTPTTEVTPTRSCEKYAAKSTDGPLRISELTLGTERVFPEKEHIIRQTYSYSREAFEDENYQGEVPKLSELDPAVEETLREVITTEHSRVQFDEIPEGLLDTLDRYKWFHCPGCLRHPYIQFEYYHADLDAKPRIEVSARIVDPIVTEDSDGKIEFIVTNNSETTQKLLSGVNPPFSILFAESTCTDGFHFWGGEVEREKLIEGEPIPITPIRMGVDLEPGASLRRSYNVIRQGQGVSPGLYSIRSVWTRSNERPTLEYQPLDKMIELEKLAYQAMFTLVPEE